ncbi:MAG: MFS transporter [Bacillota bacterium]
MEQWRRNLFITAASVLVGQVCFSLPNAFFPLYLREVGQTTNLATWAGIVAGIQALVSGAMSPVWGALADRYGTRTMILRAGGGMALGSLATALARTPMQLLVIRGMTGLVSGYVPAAMALVACTAPESQMTYALGTVQTMSSIGVIIGPALGGAFVQLIGMRGAFLFSAAVLFTISIIVVAGTRERTRPATGKLDLVGDATFVLRNRKLSVLCLTQGLSQVGLLSTQVVLPLYVATFVRSNASLYAGILLSVSGISTALGAAALSSHKTGDNFTLYRTGLIASAILLAVQGFVRSLTLLGAFRLLFGFATAVASVAASVLVVNSVGASFRGRVLGFLHLMSSFGWALGQLMGGLVGDWLGMPASFVGGGIVYGVAAAITSMWLARSSDAADRNPSVAATGRK